VSPSVFTSAQPVGAFPDHRSLRHTPECRILLALEIHPQGPPPRVRYFLVQFFRVPFPGASEVKVDVTYGLSYDQVMETVTVSGARGRLYRLLDEVAASREPVLIAGKRANAVLVAEEDWRAVQETLHLLSVPGMRESIREGMATPVSECATELKW